MNNSIFLRNCAAVVAAALGCATAAAWVVERYDDKVYYVDEKWEMAFVLDTSASTAVRTDMHFSSEGYKAGDEYLDKLRNFNFHHHDAHIVPDEVEFEGAKCKVVDWSPTVFVYCNSITIQIPDHITVLHDIRESFVQSVKSPEGYHRGLKEIRDIHDCTHFRELPVSLATESVTDITNVGIRRFGCELHNFVPENLKILADIGALPELEEVQLPPGCGAGFGENIFYDCPKLREFAWPEGTVTMGAGSLSGSGIEHLTLPESMTSIASGCLNGTNLAEFATGSRLTSIESNSLCGNKSLVKVTIPEGLKRLKGVFIGCPAVREIRCMSVVPPALEAWASEEGGEELMPFDGVTECVVVVPDEARERYASDPEWSRIGRIVALSEHETGVDAVTEGVGLHVEAAEGALRISTGRKAVVSVYDTAGNRVAGIEAEGETLLPLGTGVYIVTAGGQTVKAAL